MLNPFKFMSHVDLLFKFSLKGYLGIFRKKPDVPYMSYTRSRVETKSTSTPELFQRVTATMDWYPAGSQSACPVTSSVTAFHVSQ
jgi:hypothetical protein